jgi:hypothetical protein
MNRAMWFKILIVAAVSVALAGTPESGFAQRGGGGFHGGGGGFHGGGFGGGSGFHGGGFGGGFHNGGFGGFHGGGFGGFRGGWGFPGWGGWGWGWGLNISFGWPYWGSGYPYPWWGPYAYGYPYDPYYYPDNRDYGPDRRYVPDYRYAPDHRVPDYRHDNSKPDDQAAPAKPSTMPLPGSAPEHNYVTRNFGQQPAASGTGVTPTSTVASNFQLAASSPSTTLRPEVQNAIRLLRAMPPAARQERINSGRYANFSPDERKLLNTATQVPQEN